MIKGNELSFNYPGGKVLFYNLSFEIGSGSTLAIIGPNGAGKTTLIKCLMGFLKFNTGEIDIEGLQSKSYKDFWKLVAYVPQAKNGAFGYTILEMVVMGLSGEIGLGKKPSPADYKRAMNLLRDLGIDDICDRSCNKVSGGQLQMTLIARALIKEPKILIMDEPESHLDLKNQMRILNLIEKLNKERGMTVIINTHFPQYALKIAKSTLVIGKKGWQFGPTEEIVSEDKMKEFFGIDCKIIDLDEQYKNTKGLVAIGISE